jgi:hypothetical protein
MCLQYILVRFTPSIILPPLPFSLLRTISYVNTKYIYHIHTHSLCLYAHSLPLVPPLEKTILPSHPSFFKNVYMASPWGFCLSLQTCIYSALIKLTSHYFSLSPHLPKFNSLWCITLYYIHI